MASLFLTPYPTQSDCDTVGCDMSAGGYDNEPSCGRPLGMRMHVDGHLVVMDAYLGIFNVNIDTGRQF